MVALFFIGIILFGLTSAMGFLVGVLFRIQDEDKFFGIDRYFIGLISFTIVLQISSIFFPLQKAFWFLSIIPLVILLVQNLRANFWQALLSSIEILKTQRIGVLLVILLFLFIGSQSVYLYDTHLYHLSFLKWVESFRVVPGLANLHVRLGFNSSAIVLSSLYSFNLSFLGVIEGTYVFGLNFVSTIAFTFHLIFKGSSEYIEGNRAKSIYYLALIVLIFAYIVPTDMNSLSTDVLPALITIYIFDRIIWANGDYRNWEVVYFITLVAFILTLKVSGVLVGLILIIPIINKFSWRSIFYGGSVALLVVVPFFLRNFFLSGYLVFPFTGIDVFNVDWKVPLELAEQTARDVTVWARTGTVDNRYFDMKLTEWVPVWIDSENPINKAIIFLIPVSLIGLAINNFMNFDRDRVLIFLTLLLNEAFWFFMAPDVRFAWGIHFILVAWFSFEFYKRIETKKVVRLLSKLRFYIIVLIPLVVLTISFRYFKVRFKSGGFDFVEVFITPPPIERVRYYSDRHLGHEIRYTTDENRCSDTPIPCTPYFFKGLEMRSSNLSDGFRLQGSEYVEVYIMDDPKVFFQN